MPASDNSDVPISLLSFRELIVNELQRQVKVDIRLVDNEYLHEQGVELVLRIGHDIFSFRESWTHGVIQNESRPVAYSAYIVNKMVTGLLQTIRKQR